MSLDGEGWANPTRKRESLSITRPVRKRFGVKELVSELVSDHFSGQKTELTPILF